MSTEQQLLHNTWYVVKAGLATRHKAGQRLTIPGRFVNGLKFFLQRTGVEAPGGADYFFRIYRVADDALLAEVDLGQWNNLPFPPGGWVTGNFASVFIDTDVRICFYSTWGIDGVSYPEIAYQNADVKPGESFTRAANPSPDETWAELVGLDMAYQYIYAGPPTAQTNPATEVS